MDKERNQNNKKNLPNICFERNNLSPSNENEILSSCGSSNKANPSSDSTFLSDKNTPASSPLFSPGDSSIARSFSENLSATEIFDFDPLTGSYADLNPVAIGVADENNGSESDEKVTSKSIEELSDKNGSGSYGNISPDREITENWEENSENTASPIHSEPLAPLNPLDPLDHQETQEEAGEEDENIKRIKDWINKIEINNADMIVEEMGESSMSAGSVSSKTGQSKNQGGPSAVDPKTSVSMAMGYNYISAMNPVSASAQLSNLGLVAVPILTAFGGLRELSLSNNNILRITAGALPKGLHMLNLSKNYICAIEGLKDLTRLRILDLSYNRISRIGHGLASCSSMKELYLAANKISEIEGLHRLLKLKILDLRSNKLSTAKGLEQLAANYSSLEMISLDGNPAQRNVGDEHLKKYLLTLLPNLVYYNRHSVKLRGGPSKDRIISSHKSSRRSAGNGGNQKSRIGRNSGMSNLMRGSRGRNVNVLPPGGGAGLRLGENAGKRGLGLNPLRRVQSEGAMGV